MWKDHSKGFINKNRISSISILAAAFISALFLSLLWGLFFNFWKYETEAVILKEGNWQVRISGTYNESILSDIQNFANVKTAEINEELSDGEKLVIDLYFQDMRSIYEDMPLIAKQLDISQNTISYHELLLSKYFIYDPTDTNPPLLLVFYLVILLIVSGSLILIIHNAFAVSMGAHIHQFGIFSSVGATPRQIRSCLLQEAVSLCTLPILSGSFAGIALSFGTIQLVNKLAEGIPGRHIAVFAYHPLILLFTILSAFFTVLVSAWLPARKLSKLTPLEAIKARRDLQPKKRKKSPVLSWLFGVEGELAGNFLKAQKKALRTSTLSLTLAFLGFTLLLCFFTLSEISTDHTYFQRYQDAWDIMATVKNADMEDLAESDEIRGLNNSDCIIYQKADALCAVPETHMSNELRELGGLENVAGNKASFDGYYTIPSSIVIMDNHAFDVYCKKLGLDSDKTGCIILNRIWDSINSGFRYKKYIPYLSGESDVILLQNTEQTANSAELPVLAYTQDPPVLREEYANYTLVQFVSLSTWEEIKNIIGNNESDTYIRILSKGSRNLQTLNDLEKKVSKILEKDYTFEIENRIQEKIDNNTMINGYKLITGSLCILLAVIGMANIFSNTLGFVQQRKREFARYMSIGMTPRNMKKMFCIEALVISGRPVLITLPLTVLFVGFMITASGLDPKEFLAAAPFIPILIFLAAILAFVTLAYYAGGRKIMKCRLIDAMRNDQIL